MGKIAVALDTTPQQDKALDWLLTNTNAKPGPSRVPLPDVSALVTTLLQQAIDTVARQHQDACLTSVTDALTTATPEAWSTVASTLKVALP